MRSSIFYTIGIAFMSGIFFRSFFNFGGEAIALSILIACACFSAMKIKSLRTQSPLFVLGIFFVCFSVGVFRLHSADSHRSLFTEYENQKVVIEGRIVSEPEIRDTTILLYIEPVRTEHAVHEQILVRTDRFTHESDDLSYGDIVEVRGILTRPESFETNEGRVFDYPGFLKTKGVQFMMSRAEVSIRTQEVDTFLGTLFRGKQKFMDVLESAIPEPYAGLSEGLLLGVKRALGTDLEETFRKTGIIHIVVLSGYNIMIVVEALMFVLSFLFLPRVRMIVGIVAVVLFMLLVGLSATVVRAGIMAGLLLIARGTGRTYAVLRALVLAGVGMLLYNPYFLVHDPGFQLSFLATLGLILVAPHVESRLGMVPEFWGTRGFLTATITTQLFVLPLLLYHMGLVPLLSVAVNVLVLPMVPVAMLLAFVTGVIGLLSSTLGLFFGFFAYLSLAYIILIAEFFGSFSFASFSIPVFPFWVVMVSYGVYILLLYRLENKSVTTLQTISTSHMDKEKKSTRENEYEGWVIEVVHKSPRDVQRTSRGDSSFPFR